MNEEIEAMTQSIFRIGNEYSHYQAMYIIMHGLDLVYSYSIVNER